MKMTTATRRVGAFAFLTSFALLPACGDLNTARVDMIAYEPDGSLVAFMPTGIHVLAPSLDRESMTIAFDGLPVNTEQLGTGYNLSADGRVAAVWFSTPAGSTEKDSIVLFDMATGATGQTFQLDDVVPSVANKLTKQRVFGVVLSPQADLCFVRASLLVDEYGNPFTMFRDTVIDVASGAVLWTTDTLYTDYEYPAFSADGTRLFGYVSIEAGIEALDARTGANLYTRPLADTGIPPVLKDLAPTADGKLVGVTQPSLCGDVDSCASSFATWSAADLTPLGAQPLPPQTVPTDVVSVTGFGTPLACSSSNNLCAYGLQDVSTTPTNNYLVSVTSSDGTPLRELGHLPVAVNMAFAPDGQVLAILAGEVKTDKIRLFNVNSGALVASLSFDLNVP
jgi:hypothetical protein